MALSRLFSIEPEPCSRAVTARVDSILPQKTVQFQFHSNHHPHSSPHSDSSLPLRERDFFSYPRAFVAGLLLLPICFDNDDHGAMAASLVLFQASQIGSLSSYPPRPPAQSSERRNAKPEIHAACLSHFLPAEQLTEPARPTACLAGSELASSNVQFQVHMTKLVAPTTTIRACRWIDRSH